MKTAIIAASLALVAITANAQTKTPGYDRPSTEREHQHVVYWNDSMEHYDISMQTAADAYSTNDLNKKSSNKSIKRTDQSAHHALAVPAPGALLAGARTTQ